MKNAAIASLLLLMAGAVVAAAAPEGSEAARLAIRTKQFSQAVALLRQDARGGSADAQYLLGLVLWNGVGTAVDREAARASLQQSAEAGNAPASLALAALLAQGTAAQREQAPAWVARAAAAGYAPAIALRDAHRVPMADARTAPGLTADLRFEIARVAARNDDTALLTAIGSREVVSRKGEFGRTLLFEAADAGSPEAIQQLLQEGSVADLQDEFGTTPLMLAAAQPDVEVTRLLTAAGAAVNKVDHVGRTALFRAAEMNRAAQVPVLIAAGANVNLEDSNGWSAWDLASRRDAPAALEALRAAGGHAGTAALPVQRNAGGIDAARPGVLYQGWQPLLVAAARDDAADIRRRVAAGADLEVTTPQGASALQIAIESQAREATRVLIELGAKPLRNDRDGVDALERIVRAGDLEALALLKTAGIAIGGEAEGARLLGIAVSRGDLSMTRALLSAGQSASAADDKRMTPLMQAARAGNVEMIKLLLDRGAAPGGVDSRGRSALWYAASARSVPSVEVLLAMQSPPDAADRDGVTPLLAAIRAGGDTVVARLLLAGAAADARGAGSDPPLRAAAGAGESAIVAQLLERKAQVDATDVFGDTALMAAARNGDVAMSVKLLGAGANPRLRNRERATAAELAEARGFSELAQRLRD